MSITLELPHWKDLCPLPPHLKHTALLELADSSTVGKVFDDGACFVVLEELATCVETHFGLPSPLHSLTQRMLLSFVRLAHGARLLLLDVAIQPSSCKVGSPPFS